MYKTAYGIELLKFPHRFLIIISIKSKMEFSRSRMVFLNVISLINDMWTFDLRASDPMLLVHYAFSDARTALGD
jgi:hypothetical protein